MKWKNQNRKDVDPVAAADRSLIIQIVLSLCAMLLCVIALSSATLAYLQQETGTKRETISAAGYDVIIYDENGAEITDEYECGGASDHTYRFWLEGSGTAENGYCRVIFNEDTDNVFITKAVNQQELELVIQAEEGTVISFEACWGISSASVMDETTYGGDEILVYGDVELLSDEEEEASEQDTDLELDTDDESETDEPEK